QSDAADGAREVPWINLEIIRQSEKLLVKAGVQLGRALASVSRQIWSPDGAHEERVAREDEPWIDAALEIRREETDAFGRVSRRMQNFQVGITELNRLAVTKRRERHADIGRLVQAIERTGATRQVRATG